METRIGNYLLRIIHAFIFLFQLKTTRFIYNFDSAVIHIDGSRKVFEVRYGIYGGNFDKWIRQLPKMGVRSLGVLSLGLLSLGALPQGVLTIGCYVLIPKITYPLSPWVKLN